ncbi:MAG: Asp-tRNA(Asn)/Glu-tRNA(Gln) amidotransferase subunit GatC [Gemmatimonadetes bacterium]|nr:Asp-tRNA(Asn)/Glu-tRNA(Gln) amidotransferase subunit GatC [Gemmatimonadota bacterium]
MSVTREEVEHVARLAALGVDEQSLPTLTEQISRILDYVSQLERVEQSDQESTLEYPGPRQPLRDDQPHRTPLAVPLAQMAPRFRHGLFLVPRLGGVGANGMPAGNEEE